MASPYRIAELAVFGIYHASIPNLGLSLVERWSIISLLLFAYLCRGAQFFARWWWRQHQQTSCFLGDPYPIIDLDVLQTTKMIRLVEELLHQLFGTVATFFPPFTGVDTSQVVIAGIPKHRRYLFYTSLAHWRLTNPWCLTVHDYGQVSATKCLS